MSKNPLLEKNRIQAIDFIKGVDIILMALFNYSVTLDYFNLIRMPSGYLYRYILPISIASVFIFMSGVIAYVNYQKYRERSTSKYFLRGAKLLFFAILITLFTYVFVPRNAVFFGILHFFAVTSFLIPVFLRYNKLNLTAGLLIIISGIYLQQRTFDFSYLFWLGFIPKNLSTFDYFPLIPWLGVILLGIYYGRYIADNTANIRFRSRYSGIFIFLGEKSLSVYLIHQPLLILFLAIFGSKLF